MESRVEILRPRAFLLDDSYVGSVPASLRCLRIRLKAMSEPPRTKVKETRTTREMRSWVMVLLELLSELLRRLRKDMADIVLY